MLSKYLFRILIVLLAFAAASLASAQQGELTETAMVGEMIDETAPASVGDNGNEATPAELLPEEEVIEVEEEVLAPVVPEEPSAAACSMTVLPAVEDLYANVEKGKVYNDDHLVCEYLMGDRYKEDEFPGMVMVQFDISDIEIQEDDVTILVLKAESIEKVGDEMAGLFLMPITSEWSENSSTTALALNMLSIMVTMSSGDDLDFSQLGMNFGVGEVFVFDISEHLKAAEDGKVSFLMMAMGDTDYKVSFKSRETGEGPSLLITPYPSAPAA